MRIGLMMGATGGGATIESQVQAVVDAERDGFDSVWFGQIFGADSMTLIALAGPRTSRIELGTAVIPTYTRHPFVMAQQALTVQAATDGRFSLGVGPSHQLTVEALWGLSYEQPARHVREYLTVLRQYTQEGRAAFQGEVFRVAGELRVPGASKLPIFVSALAPMMLRIAGELSEGTITWMTGARTIETHVSPKIRAAATAAGQAAPRIVVGLPVCVTDDAAGAREAAAKALVVYGQLPNYRRMLDQEGAAGPADVAVVGDEAAVERQLRDLASAGATDFMAPIFPHGDDPQASMRRTRETVRALVGKI